MGETLVKAMLFGTVEGIDPPTLFLYQRLGLFHLFSASGYHMAAALLLSEQGGKLLTLVRMPAQQKLVLLAAFSFSLMTYFGHATNWSSPMVRAYAMASLLILAQLVGTKPSKPHLFATALLVSAFFGNSGPLSFLLSGLAMAGVLLAAGKGWMAMALAPWLFTLPVVLWHFSLLNPMAFVWNFLAIFVGLLVLPLSILALLLESIGDFYFLPGALMEIFHRFLLKFSLLDQSFWVPREAMFLAPLLAFLCRSKLTFAGSVALCLILRFILPPSLALLDVKQGDSLYFQAASLEKWLVDVGPRGSWASNSLEKIGVGSLDHMLITHLDLDHRGGIEQILSRHKVKNIWMREEHITNSKAQEILEWSERTNIALRSTGEMPPSISCWNPPLQKSSNESSVVCQALLLNEKRICLMGDAGFPTELWLLWQNPVWQKCHYLKVGHHGSRNSTSNIFLQKIEAKEAFISCGNKNRYGHPHSEVINRLERKNITVRRTDLSGTLTDSLWTRFGGLRNQILALPLWPF